MSVLKEARRKAIVEEAKKLYLEKSIEQVTIADLATHLSIGEASLYRYFGKKQVLVVEAAIMTWQEISEKMTSLPMKPTGFENLEDFYGFFLSVFHEHPEFFQFIEDFDALIAKEPLSDELLTAYEEVILAIKKRFDDFIAIGLQDGSVQCDLDPDIFYFSTSHALMGLCKKLAKRKGLLKYEDRIDKSAQIESLITIFLKYIQGEGKML